MVWAEGYGSSGDGSWEGYGGDWYTGCDSGQCSGWAGDAGKSGKCNGKSADRGKGKGKDASKGKGKDKSKDGQQVAQKLANGETLYSGRVTCFDFERNHGFIQVDKRGTDLDDQSIYVFRTTLESACAGPGDLVAFFVHWSDKGKSQASKPALRLAAEEGKFALRGFFKASNDDKGHGFFVCDATKEFFGRDVYVNKDLAAALMTGAQVAFNCYLNKDGMPNAHSCMPCDDWWKPEPGDLSTTRRAALPKGKGGKGGGGKGKGGKGSEKGGGSNGCKGKGGGGGKGSPLKGTGYYYRGVIKSFNSVNNYGFIGCDEVKAQYGNDVFVIGSLLDGVKTGDHVIFELGLNNKGQPQAASIQAVDPNFVPSGDVACGADGACDWGGGEWEGDYGEGCGDWGGGEDGCGGYDPEVFAAATETAIAAAAEAAELAAEKAKRDEQAALLAASVDDFTKACLGLDDDEDLEPSNKRLRL